ncbi:MAG TPA: helix-turn-helix domain-containing protein [Candidatus Limnocylindrales bacterium]|nr:helix-turn-helix domain-containing protein [Candidatus Limnocylindrales bacterium]
MTTRRTDLEAIAPLADPVRRRLYELVVGADAPVDRDAAAAAAGIGRANAAFHLDRLAEAGLLDVEFARRSGRSGPGAGRPAKFYRRPEREISVSLPQRQYELAAELLAEGVERRPEAAAGVLDAARRRGAALGEGSPAGDRDEALLAVLDGEGYEPVTTDDGVVRLRNCPFDALVDDHRELTCSMNLALLTGLADAVGQTQLHPVADPRDGFCCVALVRR